MANIISGDKADKVFQRIQNSDERTDNLLNSQAVTALKYTPVESKYVSTAQNVAGITRESLGWVESARDTVGFINQTGGAGNFNKEVLREGAVSALDSLSEQVSVGIDRCDGHNKLAIKKASLRDLLWMLS